MDINAQLNTRVTFEPKFYYTLIGGFFILGCAILLSRLGNKN